MGHAILTTSALGFMLRDLNKEFMSRFADELSLCDRNAHALACHNGPNRSQLSAIIGEGNCHFYKYSLLGHYYLFLLIIFDEITQNMHAHAEETRNAMVEDIISRPSTYSRLALFTKEISAHRLASTARTALTKYKNDYKICSFYRLVEWRLPKHQIKFISTPTPHPNDFKTIILDHNAYHPSILSSMHQNSQNLATHLQSILQLKTDQGQSAPRNTATSTPEPEYLEDHQILDYAMAHDLPIFVAIDGSLDENGVATVSTAIIAPDIKDSDPTGSLNWLSRLAKVLLIRSWRLPKKWGTTYACINMAESIGFILGEYTIPAHLPIIYITDSNNARTLQRRVRHINNYTHRQRVRQIKQGIDYSIANHLELLTSKWPPEDQLPYNTLRLYTKGEELCRSWALFSHQQTRPPPHHPHQNSHNSSTSNDLSSTNSSLSTTSDIQPLTTTANNTRSHFNSSMYDLLGKIIVVKVFSHQLNKNFTPKDTTAPPSPNLFTVSANQHADNAATQAKHIIMCWVVIKVTWLMWFVLQKHDYLKHVEHYGR